MLAELAAVPHGEYTECALSSFQTLLTAVRLVVYSSRMVATGWGSVMMCIGGADDNRCLMRKEFVGQLFMGQ